MLKLSLFFKPIGPLSTNLWGALEECLIEKNFAKKEYLLKTGDVSRYIYFIESGILMQSFSKYDMRIPTAFPKENEVCLSTESFLNQENSKEDIQALEPTRAYCLSYEHYIRLIEQYQEFSLFCVTLLQSSLQQKEQRWRALWMEQSYGKYQWLCQSCPDLLPRVPYKFLASYAGMNKVTISRIKKNAMEEAKMKTRKNLHGR